MWLDKTRASLYRMLCGTARWFDSFFGDSPRYDATLDESWGRLGVGTDLGMVARQEALDVAQRTAHRPEVLCALETASYLVRLVGTPFPALEAVEVDDAPRATHDLDHAVVDMPPEDRDLLSARHRRRQCTRA